MSRLLGAAYGVFSVVLLAPPLVMMRAGRDVEEAWQGSQEQFIFLSASGSALIEDSL